MEITEAGMQTAARAEDEDVQHVRGAQRDGVAFHSGGLVIASLVAVVKLKFSHHP